MIESPSYGRPVASPQRPRRIGAELQGRVSYSLIAVVIAALAPVFVLTAAHVGPQSLALGVLLVGLLGLAVLVGRGLGGELQRDVATLTQTARKLSEARLDQKVRLLAVAPRAATAEVSGLQQALEGLLDRARRLQVEIFLATERTIEARRAKSQHLAATSHDLRNALSPVLGFTDLLAGGYEGELTVAGQRRMARMQRQGRRLLRILSEILDTAKLESQTIDLHPRDCSAAELFAQAVSEVRRLRSIDVLPMRVEIAPDLPPVGVDPIRFPQALSYLCGHVIDSLDAETEAGATGADNAARPHDVPPVIGELLLRAYQAKDRAAVVFEVAYLPGQTPAGPVLGKTGLGLALPLARRLLALHGGSIAVVADVFPCLRATMPITSRTR